MQEKEKTHMNYMEKVINQIRADLADLLPPEAKISNVEFEGPFLVLYSQSTDLLMENGGIIKNLAKHLRKRIVIRSDTRVRLPQEEAEKIIREIVPPESEITDITFDDLLGECVIEARKPGLVIGQSGKTLREITKIVFWRPTVVRTLPMKSSIISSIRSIYQKESSNRKKELVNIGIRIHRPLIFDNDYVRLTPLGGSGEVGRSCLLIETTESKVLIDCGLGIGSTDAKNLFPYLNAPEFRLEDLDAVIVSHAHLDHSGLVPFLYKYGYRGPVYCNDATLSLMTLLQRDYLKTADSEDKLLPYSQRDIVSTITHSIPRRFSEVTDISPDIRLTLSPAGHILGSAIIHLHIGNGKYNLAVAQDLKFSRSRLLTPANSKFPRLETIIMESTLGGSRDIMPSRRESESQLIRIINRTIRRRGKVLIPTLAVGKAQELMVILDHYLRRKDGGIIQDVPIYLDGMIYEASAIYCTFPEYLSHELQNAIFSSGQNPFLAESFVSVDSRSRREEVYRSGGPGIILATSGMLEGGASVEYFHRLAPDDRNSIIFTSYQAEKTLGRRVSQGTREIRYFSGGKMGMTMVNLDIHTINGFSGHSDRNQLLSYVRKLSPKPRKIILVHGNYAKSQALAQSISQKFRISTEVCHNLESLRLT
ncbi:MAG: beta-CASP ribonuclease aCPSF1 [Candidatus Hodarchaeales archaeon]|jgi:KH/beta-lactamase-domain protein